VVGGVVVGGVVVVVVTGAVVVVVTGAVVVVVTGAGMMLLVRETVQVTVPPPPLPELLH